VATLVAKTDGWPAGLYLAALSLDLVSDKHAYVAGFGASNRHVLDFLVTEVLQGQDPALQTLMRRSSILERISGPLCAAVTGESDSTEMLAALAATNLFLTPLDDEGGAYRFHTLFRQLLHVELERREPALIPMLHRRAYEWHREHGNLEEAIEHALEAEAFSEAADMIEASWIWFYSHYRQATVLAWLRRFPAGMVTESAELLLINAWMLALGGVGTGARRGRTAGGRQSRPAPQRPQLGQGRGRPPEGGVTKWERGPSFGAVPEDRGPRGAGLALAACRLLGGWPGPVLQRRARGRRGLV